ncbi:MAG: hypothetical protein CVV13_06690 [Gammaproteobacteria bacterium HGW-Gammaproteobacteria-3]|nr:MAG: hypothetical protein CVV13_06690 [Gammaproteobacteria bacterium HGW-Gammaproteobacteria-3]
MFRVKDFIETSEGLVFAVVENGTEQGRVLCFLRYVMSQTGWQKQSTLQANAWLDQHYPEYRYYSPLKDAHLHAVPASRISRHYQPRQRLPAIVQDPCHDPVEKDLQRLYRLFRELGIDVKVMGVTGSLLLGAQNVNSDIDLVFYDRVQFHQARTAVRELIGRGLLQDLGEADWLASYDRRGCHLSLEEYRRHEQRKDNKALINGRKFDLSLVNQTAVADERWQKYGKIVLQCPVSDAAMAFDYPALLQVEHPEIKSVVSYTATYTGQALAGERIEVAGCLEKSEAGVWRIVVGSSREAEAEFIKVVG